jgi:hypothetical protein
MNMLDMHTRERINRNHLDEMHREARSGYLLRDTNSTDYSAGSTRRIRRALAVAALILLVGAFLAAPIIGF